MADLDFTYPAGSWLRSSGPDSDVVLSTRIRLARNVEGYPFPNRISPEQRRDLEARLKGWIAEARIADGIRYCNLASADPVMRRMLAESHLISRELEQGEGDRGVSFSTKALLSVMTNEEDHLRIQVLRPGQALDCALDQAVEVDKKLEARIPYAYSPDYGFLTACPTNAGTGLRISVMMHLPGLVISDQMDKVFQAAAKVRLAVRGFYGEGSQAIGDVIQVSNQQTLGRSEQEILDSLRGMIPKIVEYERGVRQHLMSEQRMKLEDRIWRAMGTLRYARAISSEEALGLLSSVRLGAQLKVLGDISVTDVNELLVVTQPGHLQALKDRELGPDERDVARATLLRDRFKPDSGRAC